MTKRWCLRGKLVEKPGIDEFLNEVAAVSRKHGLSIVHEDGHGSFVVVPYQEEHTQWLSAADDGTEGGW